MNKVISFFKMEFSGWSKLERIAIPILLLSVISISLYLNDTIIATIQAVFSLSYSLFAGKGKISCYFFGIIGTLCYSFLSFKNALYGSLILQMGYFLPMEIIGIFKWKNHLKPVTNDVVKTQLSNKERIFFAVIILFSAILFSFFLRFLGAKFPVMDSFATVFSVAAMYMTIKRCIEQWILWTGVNILSAIMWLVVYLSGAHTFATMLTWLIHLVLGIYFFFQWKKEL